MKKPFTFFLLLSLMASVSSFKASAQVELDHGLVAYYPFNNNTLDATSNGNDGTSSGSAAPVADRFGKENSAIGFGGLDSPGAVEVQNSESLTFSTGATFAFWAKFNSNIGQNGWGHKVQGGYQSLISKADDGSSFYNYSYVSADLTYAELQFGNSGNTALNTRINSYSLEEWFHVSYVVSETGIALYINGVFIKDATEEFSFAGMNQKNLFIGRFGNTWYPLNGAVDELRVYNRALNESEISALASETQITIVKTNGTEYCPESGETLEALFILNDNVGTDASGEDKEYHFELSDASGDFSNPTEFGLLNTSESSDAVKGVIPADLAPGSYKFRIVDATGAVSNEEVLTINETPGGAITSNGEPIIDNQVTICSGSGISLVAPAGENPVWSNEETTQEIIVTEDGEYYVTIEENGCSGNSDTVTVIVDICTSALTANHSLLNVSPNPATEQVEVKWPAELGIRSVVVVDINGQVLNEYSVDGLNNKVLDLGSYSPGVLNIRLIGNDVIQNLKVVKQ